MNKLSAWLCIAGRLIRTRGIPCPNDPVAPQPLRRSRRSWSGKDSQNGAIVLSLGLIIAQKCRAFIQYGRTAPNHSSSLSFRLRSNSRAEALLRRYGEFCRKVWNLAIAERRHRYAASEKYANYVAMSKWLTAWKQDPVLAFHKEAPTHLLQIALKALDGTYQRFLAKKGGYPKFKRFGEPTGLRETDVDCFEIDNIKGKIRFPKVGWLRYRKGRDIEGTPKIVTIRRGLDGWIVSIIAELHTK